MVNGEPGGYASGYEIFGGNTTDVTRVSQIVEKKEDHFGKVNRDGSWTEA
jgi:hypothetical protein